MAEEKSDSVKRKKAPAKASDSKSKKGVRKLLPPANLGTLTREEIRKGIEAVIARRKASQQEGENLET